MACAILAFGLGVIYDQFRRTAEPSQRYTHRAQARMLAEKQLAELCASSVDSLSAFKPPAKFQKIASNEVFYSRVEIASTAQGASGITVYVGWKPTGGPEALEFPTGQVITAKGTRSP